MRTTLLSSTPLSSHTIFYFSQRFSILPLSKICCWHSTLVNPKVSSFSETYEGLNEDNLSSPAQPISVHSNSPFISNKSNFLERHIGPFSSKEDVNNMLKVIGVPNIQTLINETIPQEILIPNWFNSTIQHGIPKLSDSEENCLNKLKELADLNKNYKCYIGMGYHNSILPEVIKRNVFEDSTWYSAYTPYQAEISQGRLESLLNFQTLICELTGLDVSNASLLDEGSAAAEAVLMAYRISGSSNKNNIFLSSNIHPQTIDVIKTRANLLNINCVIGDHQKINITENYFATVVQYPDTYGNIYNYNNFSNITKLNKSQFIVISDPLSLCLLKPPSQFGADIVVGSSQRFGVPMGFGGPHAAFIATLNKNTKRMPGRIIGTSIDSDGNKAYRMALQTREQHIRRDKATSNICTSQALLANIAAMYAVYHGSNGLKNIAKSVHYMANLFHNGIKYLGFQTQNEIFFDTICLNTDPFTSQDIVDLMIKNEINIRTINEKLISLSFDETTTVKDIEKLLSIFAQAKGEKIYIEKIIEMVGLVKPIKLDDMSFERKDEFLMQKNFNIIKSETQMMRYIKQLEKKDISLNKSMISLGSCTMKLNPSSALYPILWPQFANIHPFSPSNQTKGYQKLINDLSNYLAFITGFDAVSLQPNSGATGELAGLITIKLYQQSIGQSNRNICLIPKSSHGTNPASAALTGMTIKLIDADINGKINIEQLEKLAIEYKNDLSVLMITYPSTMGVFEKDIEKICSIIHQNGGCIYMDGANMNAQLGHTSPGFIGADVCHLNLHKTFAIPHGGGGPGVGPICVKKHLSPFLMSHRYQQIHNQQIGPPVASAAYGSAMVLPITWMYIHLMGLEGLKLCGEYAILNANYMMYRLKNYYLIKFVGHNNRCAHEFIISVEQFKKNTNITEEDIAKRLIDYGFHAPTMSWPIPSSLMIEPTESEDKDELDRFCDAMISIRNEIAKIENGTWPKDDNPLKNAPHTEIQIASDNWNHPYSRELAAFPLPWIKERGKFWPSVSRINNAYGERNLICTCN